MKIRDYDGLIIITHDFNIADDSKEDVEDFFFGEPHYLFKFCRFGGTLGWKPLSMEICLVDDDDYDRDYGYTPETEHEFDIIVTDICTWFNEQDKNQVTFTDIMDFVGMPHFEKFVRVF